VEHRGWPHLNWSAPLAWPRNETQSRLSPERTWLLGLLARDCAPPVEVVRSKAGRLNPAEPPLTMQAPGVEDLEAIL
jgi:hypothetical protein